MPAWDDKQLAYGWSVRNVKRGDLMFFREYGGHGRVTHVGIYYGRGRIIHSSSYFNEVVISEVQYIENNFDNHRIR
jgi:cell wall-associated NlpC family hydrolase